MTAHDVHLTDISQSANILNEVPSRMAHVQHAEKVPAPFGMYRSVIKRALDITLILVSLPIVLPVVALLALCVARDGGRPFYTQDRIGKGGRIYKIWKLRSMVHNADAVLEDHLARDPALRAEWDSKQKLINDPRITRFGHVLRKCSLDELPQLWNVLRGDMSLVGPRPMMVSQKDLYPGTDYYQLRPGITGFWQISDRNGTTFADRSQYDAAYNREVSFKTDVKILVGTLRVVLDGTGH